MKTSFFKSKLLCSLFLLLSISLVANAFAAEDKVVMPDENGTKKAIDFEYFPSRQHAFVWRNWSVVDKERLAEVMATSVKNV